MIGSNLAELLINGVRVTVSKQAALDLFERNRALLVAGRIEATQIELVGGVPEVLHLVIGAAPLALITGDDTGDLLPEVNAADDEHMAATEVFPDFDRYALDSHAPPS